MQKTCTTPLHPQSGDLVERFHRCMERLSISGTGTLICRFLVCVLVGIQVGWPGWNNKTLRSNKYLRLDIHKLPVRLLGYFTRKKAIFSIASMTCDPVTANQYPIVLLNGHIQHYFNIYFYCILVLPLFYMNIIRCIGLVIQCDTGLESLGHMS